MADALWKRIWDTWLPGEKEKPPRDPLPRVEVLRKWTCKQLSAELRERNVQPRGLKEDLVQQLSADDQRERAQREAVATGRAVPPHLAHVFEDTPAKMYASTAVTKFRIPWTALEDLPCEVVDNPHGGAPARLYAAADVRRLARELHKSDEGLARAMEMKKERGQKARETRMAKMGARRAKLQAALAAVGCHLRGDSRLCNAYIDHGEGGVAAIADTMREMKFYFENTNYEEHYAEEVRAEMEYKGRYYPDDVSASAKGGALSEWCDQFDTVEDALARPELPPTLVDYVQNHFVYNRAGNRGPKRRRKH